MRKGGRRAECARSGGGDCKAQLSPSRPPPSCPLLQVRAAKRDKLESYTSHGFKYGGSSGQISMQQKMLKQMVIVDKEAEAEGEAMADLVRGRGERKCGQAGQVQRGGCRGMASSLGVFS